MINIDKGVSIILNKWLSVQKDELIHFITDETHMREAEAFSRWAYGADAVRCDGFLLHHDQRHQDSR